MPGDSHKLARVAETFLDTRKVKPQQVIELLAAGWQRTTRRSRGTARQRIMFSVSGSDLRVSHAHAPLLAVRAGDRVRRAGRCEPGNCPAGPGRWRRSGGRAEGSWQTPGEIHAPTGPWQTPGQIHPPTGPWQTPGEIHAPTGPWQKPGEIQVPKGIQALRSIDTACERRVSVVADALFDFDKSDLRPDAVETLAALGPEIAKAGRHPVVVEGHTDGIGTDAYNFRLSEQRARSVRDWLVRQGWFPAIRRSRGMARRGRLCRPDGRRAR